MDKHDEMDEQVAALCNAVGGLIEQMIDQSDQTKQEIAKRAGMTVERLNEILEGNGNVRISTLARIAAATDYAVTVTAENGENTVSAPRRSQRTLRL